MSLKPNQDAKNIGARFRSARSLVPDLNRKLFCERHGINRYTMQSWENGLHVSKGKNVEKFIEALAREGVYCTSEWLIDGKGDPAKPLAGTNHKPSPPADDGLTETQNAGSANHFDHIINRLTAAYHQVHERLVSFSLPDDAMAPKFLNGDMVFGLEIDPDLASAHQKYCIIELSPERLVVRKVLVTKDGFLLIALDERLPSFTLGLGSKIYGIVWHLVKQ